jgi:hypothetical protein
MRSCHLDVNILAYIHKCMSVYNYTCMCACSIVCYSFNKLKSRCYATIGDVLYTWIILASFYHRLTDQLYWKTYVICLNVRAHCRYYRGVFIVAFSSWFRYGSVSLWRCARVVNSIVVYCVTVRRPRLGVNTCSHGKLWQFVAKPRWLDTTPNRIILHLSR